jgi:hypothetical protein
MPPASTSIGYPVVALLPPPAPVAGVFEVCSAVPPPLWRSSGGSAVLGAVSWGLFFGSAALVAFFWRFRGFRLGLGQSRALNKLGAITNRSVRDDFRSMENRCSIDVGGFLTCPRLL